MTAFSDTDIKVKTDTKTHIIPLASWYDEIIPYLAEVKLDNGWAQMDDMTSFKLVRSHLFGETEVKYSVGRFDYELKWHAEGYGSQTNTSTKTSRYVRLNPVSEPKLPPLVLDSKNIPNRETIRVVAKIPQDGVLSS